MNMKLYNAAHSRIHSMAMEALARLEAKLNSVDPTALNKDIVDGIVQDAADLAQFEGALLTMQQYFRPTPAAPAQPPGPSEEPIIVTPEMSPTYKKSIEDKKIKSGAISKRKKKKDE